MSSRYVKLYIVCIHCNQNDKILRSLILEENILISIEMVCQRIHVNQLTLIIDVVFSLQCQSHKKAENAAEGCGLDDLFI